MRLAARPMMRSALLLAAAAAVCGCGGTPPAGDGAATSGEPVAPFTDVTEASGLDFVHWNGMSGELYLMEMMGPGVALLDHDGDGDLDLFVFQGTMLGPGKTEAEATFPRVGPRGHRLYRNDTAPGPDGAPRLRFTDVSDRLGVEPAGYAMGVAAGDYDGDGLVDLYVTAWGPNQLLRNRGDGSFEDVTAEAGAGEERWSVSATFVDHDADGDLDLYVGNYLDLTYANHRKCFAVRDDYCSPKAYNPVPDRLLENRGDGTFRDATADSGIARAYGAALGVVAADLDRDGRVDLYVANDGSANQLWRNRGDGTFEDVALLGGAALNEMGEAEAGMGVDAGDVDGDGDEDLFVAHLATETNTLYVNDGAGNFEDGTTEADLAAASLPYTGFGASLFDYDGDGALDVFVANGAVTVIERRVLEGDPFPLDQRNQLFHNLGDGRFEDVTEAAGAPFAIEEVSRGAAFGDLDDDGDLDVVVTNNAGPLRLLRNDVGNRNPWIGIRAIAGDPPRDALGAYVEVVLDDGRRLVRRVRTDGSYASANDPRALVGLGPDADIREILVRWPGGGEERFVDLEPGRWHTVRRGGGTNP